MQSHTSGKSWAVPRATSSQVCAPSCDPTAPVGHTKCHLCSRSSSTDIFGASALGPVLGVQRLLSQMWSRPQRAFLVVGDTEK